MRFKGESTTSKLGFGTNQEYDSDKQFVSFSLECPQPELEYYFKEMAFSQFINTHEQDRPFRGPFAKVADVGFKIENMPYDFAVALHKALGELLLYGNTEGFIKPESDEYFPNYHQNFNMEFRY